MHIGVLQVDGHYPNLALMQVCAWHESRGDQVEWWEGPLFNFKYDKIYASKIFSFSEMPELPAHAVIGGTGIDFTNMLPFEITQAKPSYSLYPECNYHIGFSMKGCRFRCKFCCVPQKEGRPHHNSSIPDLLINPKGANRLMLLDNDFFGSPNWREDIGYLIETKIKVCFIQGLNIRIITDEQATLLSQTNYFNSKFNQRYLTFAWDRYRDGKIIMDGIKRCNAAGIPCNKMQFFVLIGFDTAPAEDMARVTMLRNLGCMPFVMPYNKNDPYQKAFTRWVNNRAVFKSCTWDEYRYNISGSKVV